MTKERKFYKPSRGDLRFNEYVVNGDAEIFDKAYLLKGVSYEYLSIMLHDNAGNEHSAGFKEQVLFEVARRNTRIAFNSYVISIVSVVIASISAMIAVFY